MVLMVLIEPLCFMLKRALHIFLLFFRHKLSARTIENNISCGLSSSVAFAYKVQKLYALFMLKLDLSRFFLLSLPGTLFFSFDYNRNKYRCIVADCKATCFFPFSHSHSVAADSFYLVQIFVVQIRFIRHKHRYNFINVLISFDKNSISSCFCFWFR